MRAQYKVLAEKYSVITEALLTARYKPIIKKVINCTTFEQVVETIKASGMGKAFNFGYFALGRSVNQVCKEKGINSEEATVSLFQLIVQVYFYLHPYPEDIEKAKTAWKNWWGYYETIKKAAEQMKSAEDKANIKLDI